MLTFISDGKGDVLQNVVFHPWDHSILHEDFCLSYNRIQSAFNKYGGQNNYK